MKKLIKQILRENLNFKQMELDNKSTIPKIPINKIYQNPIGSVSGYYRTINQINFDNIETLPKETINVSDIIPTQVNLNINNLRSTVGISRDTEAVVLEVNGKFYVLDGHHRVANRILNGDSKLFARVVHLTQ